MHQRPIEEWAIGKLTWTIILFKREQDLKDTQTQFGQNQRKLDQDRDAAKQQNFPELFMFSPIMITTHIRAAQVHFAEDTQTWWTNYSGLFTSSTYTSL